VGSQEVCGEGFEVRRSLLERLLFILAKLCSDARSRDRLVARREVSHEANHDHTENDGQDEGLVDRQAPGTPETPQQRSGLHHEVGPDPVELMLSVAASVNAQRVVLSLGRHPSEVVGVTSEPFALAAGTRRRER
jgi:hypothetical protein